MIHSARLDLPPQEARFHDMLCQWAVNEVARFIDVHPLQSRTAFCSARRGAEETVITHETHTFAAPTAEQAVRALLEGISNQAFATGAKLLVWRSTPHIEVSGTYARSYHARCRYSLVPAELVEGKFTIYPDADPPTSDATA